MPDYSQGKIYIIRSPSTIDVYIGSTTQKYLCQRFAEHRKHYIKYLQNKHNYMTSFDVIQYDDAYIELLELVNCTCVEELNKKEAEYIRNNPNCINERIPGRDYKQYYQDNKEKYKQYHENNKEYRNEIKRQKYAERKKNITA